MQGKIIKGIAGFYYIFAENGEIYECRAKGIFRKDNFKPLVGDDVEIDVLDEREKEGSVTAVLPRKNSLIRPAVANVDQAFVIFAMENPKPNFLQQGRILVPQTLREFAGLDKDVVLTGNLNRVEVWSKEKWSENCNYDDMDSIAESMEKMGIVI